MSRSGRAPTPQTRCAFLQESGVGLGKIAPGVAFVRR